MCAHQPDQPLTSDEERREKVFAARTDESLHPDQVKRIAREHLPWKDWLLAEFLRYWYWLGVLALTVFGLMDLASRYHVRDTLGIGLLAALFILLLALETKLYIHIWPEGSLTRFGDKD